MFGTENEQVVSEEFEQYISQIVGSVDCGERKYIGDDIIIDLEQSRVMTARSGIIALYELYVPVSQNAPKHLQAMHPNAVLSASDFEKIIHHFNLGILKMTLDKANANREYYYNRRASSSGVKYDMNNGIYRRARYYGGQLEELINLTNEKIRMLSEGQEPLLKPDDNNISYKKRFRPFSRVLTNGDKK